MKKRINLYSPAFLPAKLWLSFINVFRLNIAVISLFLLVGIFVFQRGLVMNKSLSSKQTQLTQLQNTNTQLKQQIKDIKPNPALVSQLDLQNEKLYVKRLLLNEFHIRNTQTSMGFSGLLTDFASITDPRVWLSRIYVTSNQIKLEGFTTNPDRVPMWISQFEPLQTLAGISFSSINIEQQKRYFKFSMVSSQSEDDAAINGEKRTAK